MALHAISHAAAVELRLERRPELRDRVAAWYVGGVLVDSGGEHTAAELAGWLATRPLDAVLVGHHHEDHAGGLAPLVARGATVHGSRATAARLRRPSVVPEYRASIWGQRPAVRVLPPDGLRLLAVPLPGHSPDQLGYLDPRSGWLFSGDLVLRREQSVAMPGEDPWAMMASLRTAIDLKPSALATSHRSLIETPEPVLRRTLSYLEALAGTILTLHERGDAASVIVKQVFGGEPLVPGTTHSWRQVSRGEFSALRWVRAFLGRRGAEPDHLR